MFDDLVRKYCRLTLFMFFGWVPFCELLPVAASTMFSLDPEVHESTGGSGL